MEFSVGELAKKMNISVHTLRYYDDEGLLRHVKRSPNGRRIFTQRDVIMLNTIECLKSVGMSLKDIKQYIDWCEEGFSTVQKRYDLFAEKKELVERQIEELEHILKTINGKCDFYKNALKTGSVEVCDSEREAFAIKIINEYKKLHKKDFKK